MLHSHSKIHLKIAVALFLILAPACLQTTIAAADKPVPKDGIYDLKQVDKAPQVRGIQAAPVYPLEMKKKGLSGSAMIEFVVGTDGTVGNIKIKASKPAILGKACPEAVAKWKYRPAMLNGQPVKCRIQVPIEAKFNDTSIFQDGRNAIFIRPPVQ